MAFSNAASWFKKQYCARREANEANRDVFMIASPMEPNISAPVEQRAAFEGVRKGVRAAAATCIVTAIPTVLGTRMMSSRARFYMNYTAQASIISAATMAAYFIVADKATLANARAVSQKRILEQRSANSATSINNRSL